MIMLKTILKEIYDTNLLETDGNYKIFCDLDGVLVDFNKAISQMTGGLSYDAYIKLNGHDKLWKLINDKGSIWWATLPWTTDGKQLWNYIKNKDTTILTAASVRNSGNLAKTGKADWVFKNLGPNIKIIATDSSKDKQQYAKPNYILIDDLDSNIEEWKSKGGIAIKHVNTKSTIDQLNNIFIKK